MDKIKQLDTGKCKLLAVMVPEGYWEYNIIVDGLLSFINNKLGRYRKVNLPEGNWQILGLSNELTEEQWVDIIKSEEWPMLVRNQYYWPDFDCIDGQVTESAKESGLSLLEANQIYSVNPLAGVKRYVPGPLDSSNSVWYTKEQWQEAKSNTGLYLILKEHD